MKNWSRVFQASSPLLHIVVNIRLNSHLDLIYNDASIKHLEILTTSHLPSELPSTAHFTRETTKPHPRGMTSSRETYNPRDKAECENSLGCFPFDVYYLIGKARGGKYNSRIISVWRKYAELFIRSFIDTSILGDSVAQVDNNMLLYG